MQRRPQKSLIKKLLSAVTMIIVLLIMNPPAAHGQTIDVSDAYNGEIKTVSGNVTLTGTTTKKLEIRCVDDTNLTIDNLNINLQAENHWDACALVFYTNTNNTLTLVGNNVIKSGGNKAGIEVPTDSTLTIKGSGSLDVWGGAYGAGIGSSNNLHGPGTGTVIITGGTINAKGGNYAAGIGGGRQRSNGRVEISGGTVAADGYVGAGIGGGGAYETDTFAGNGGDIVISGGSVTAWSDTGAGIGSGGDWTNNSNASGGNGGNITVSGGVVAASGYRGGAGIGSGRGGGSVCSINISDGIVTAQSYALAYSQYEDICAAGIGGGYGSSVSSITISGGEVYAARPDEDDNSYGCSQDIGSGKGTTGLFRGAEISGTAAVFLKHHLCEDLTTYLRYVNYETISNNSAYGYTNFPDGWSGTAYGYLVRYTVDFDGKGYDGGSLPATRYYYLSDPDRTIPEPEEPNLPTKTGYTLSGWYESLYCTGSEWDFASDEVTRTMTLHAKWTANDYTVTYLNLKGAENTNPADYTIADTPVTLEDPEERTGYTFAGWFDNAEFEGSAVTSIPAGSMGDRHYWAKWTEIDYPITYNNLHEVSNENPASYTIEDDVITLIDPDERTGYAFAGWFDNAKFEGSALNFISAGSTGDRQYWAKWMEINYPITYNNLHGVSNDNPVIYTIEDGVILLEEPGGRTGYTFAGWFDNADLEGSAVSSIPAGSTGDRQYWAKWIEINYPIGYNNLYEVSNENPASYTIEDDAITLIDLEERTGYTFAGWFDNAEFEGSEVTSVPAGSTGGKQYWAKWTANDYIIRFHGNTSTNGSMSPQIIRYDSSAELNKAAFSKSSYSFAGWSTKSDSRIEYADEDKYLMDTEGIDLYAQWEPIPVKDIAIINAKNSYELGITETIYYEIVPSNAENNNVMWTSDNPAVASVDRYGTVTANKAGTTVITVTAEDTTEGTISDSVTVNVVVPGPAESPNEPDDSSQDTVAVFINVKSLPRGTTAIQTASDEVFNIENDDMVQIEVNKQDIGSDGTIIVKALDDSSKSLGTVEVDIYTEEEALLSINNTSGKILQWVLIGLVVFAASAAGVLIILKVK